MTLSVSFNSQSNSAMHWAEPTAPSQLSSVALCPAKTLRADPSLFPLRWQGIIPLTSNGCHEYAISAWETVNQLVTGAHSYFFIMLWQSRDRLKGADGELIFYPVLTSTVPEVSPLFRFSFKEPVAIGTWQVDLIVSIGMQTPLGFSHAEEEPVKRFFWSSGILTMLPTGTVSLSIQWVVPLSWKSYPAGETDMGREALWSSSRQSL